MTGPIVTVVEAQCIRRELVPQLPRQFQSEQHYLLYASAGAMRLEVDGTAWSLPPARAALVAAGSPVRLVLNQQMSVCSVLFSTSFAPPPTRALSVFEMSGLARELVMECGRTADEGEPLSEYRRSLFQTLQLLTWGLAETPSPATMPTGNSPAVIKALELTNEHLSESLHFDDLAQMSGQTPRTLARKLSAETGLSWGQIVQKMRMIRAIEMLAETRMPVTEVALGVGYQSLSAFNAAFRHFTGQSPTTYRAGFRLGGF